jgi:hypothetical protein
VPSPQQHIEWAHENQRAYAEAVEEYNQTRDPIYLADAMRNAYGELLNWMDADQRQLAGEAKERHDECRAALEAELRRRG